MSRMDAHKPLPPIKKVCSKCGTAYRRGFSSGWAAPEKGRLLCDCCVVEYCAQLEKDAGDLGIDGGADLVDADQEHERFRKRID